LHSNKKQNPNSLFFIGSRHSVHSLVLLSPHHFTSSPALILPFYGGGGGYFLEVYNKAIKSQKGSKHILGSSDIRLPDPTISDIRFGSGSDQDLADPNFGYPTTCQEACTLFLSTWSMI
ncbi:Zonadhesin, partial [Bienertia sinuspersici]